MSETLETIAERAMRTIQKGSSILRVTALEMWELQNSFMAEKMLTLVHPAFPSGSDVELHFGDFGYGESDWDRALRKVCLEHGWSIPRHAELQVIVVREII